VAPRARRPPPKPYRFTAEDRAKYNGRWWRAPHRLAEDGTLARLWREEGTTRGGGTASAVLPVLALHTWPGKESAHAKAAGLDDEPGWTGWTFLSRRRIARLAGVDKDTATAALRRLQGARLLDVRRVPRAKYEGGFRSYYRLSARLYPGPTEEYAALPGRLIYSGAWSMLPTNAARHVFLVLTCLDPIGDEDAYLEKIRADSNGDCPWQAEEIPAAWWERYTAADIEALQRLRWLGQYRQTLSLRELEAATGVRRATLVDALRALSVPAFGDRPRGDTDRHYPPIALIAKGEADDRRPTWYAPDRRAWDWSWNLDVLNDPARVRSTQRELWPTAEDRRERQRERERAEDAAALAREIGSLRLSPWAEAQAVAELKRRAAGNGQRASHDPLAARPGRSSAVISAALRIAEHITPAVLEAAGISDDELHRLAHAALFDAARKATAEARARELRRAVKAGRFTSRRVVQ
jgi:hypothetical protein